MKMSRIDYFNTLKKDPYYSRLCPKLKPSDIDAILSFISHNDALGYSEFEERLNRLYIDKEKPKNWKLILEILMISNRAKV
ncbi:MAG: hypothetical protein BWY19_00819 [bacterium ADurb.Bin212]|nr:MAG: hypothetical protein BWY19_00819 [bacterium ADurb.Bin212]